MYLQSQNTQHTQIPRQLTRIPHLRERSISARIFADACDRGLAASGGLIDTHASLICVHPDSSIPNLSLSERALLRCSIRLHNKATKISYKTGCRATLDQTARGQRGRSK